jgi:hypothetical protein
MTVRPVLSRLTFTVWGNAMTVAPVLPGRTFTVRSLSARFFLLPLRKLTPKTVQQPHH